MNRRRALTALVLGVAAPGALAACVSRPGQKAAAPEPPPTPSLEFTPANDAQDVLPTTAVSLQVKNGWLQHVDLTNADGKVVAGTLNRDRTAFTVTEPLGYGASYTWAGSAVGRDGKALPVAASFTTVDPTTRVNGQFQLSDGQTVGVAAPIILQFDAAIDDEHKPDVERALTVTTEPPTEGSWAWLPDEVGGSRAHWRTREYYQPGTKVHVDARLYGVRFGEDAYGATDSTLDFDIGRRQVVKADAPSHRIQVITDDGVIMDFPCSYGEADLPRNVTRSGIHVVTEKYADFYMSNPAAGYSDVHERWAVRISNNGEFIHANPASSGAQGNTNVTNGCINLSTGDAEQYFGTAVYGDPVEVTGTSIELSYADGDIWDWAVDWNDWKAMSALSDARPETSMPSSAPATPTDAPTLSGTPTTTTTTTSPTTTAGVETTTGSATTGG
ncbi:Ig-like domain-containing protein [Mycobacterium sp. CVI_P3]|uniref:Ig-like domain-containing protein n=1 Tax=Mycobacterium pinniadriaticum TaxID=2994102 RepID=A0ABT3SJH0_9MYCO|nr:Ig-like domain-containing protein [Mycobacterium pinniadriaticum]MCX2933256.1 Ig-like domain-containing protein [Mycobacterium pinniadriaticum]MCX2939678.1 Ig-like domain-containing protein [Mycobacterium pinniadriaticum]